MMSRTVRATIRYGRDFAEVIRCIPIQAVPRSTDVTITNRTTGAWIEVVDAGGKTVHRQVLPDPFAGQEAFGEDGEVARHDVPNEQFISLELPWPGEGAQMRIHARKSQKPQLGAAPKTSLVAALPLRPRLLHPSLAATAPLPRVRPIWGSTNPKALTLAFFAEGFNAADMPRFHQVVDRCVTAFEHTEPFKSHLASMKVAEIETISNVSGISGTAPRDTVFKAHFQKDIVRVILADQRIASEMLDACFHGSAVCLIVANTTDYGGSGGAATVFSCEPTWATEIAMHELGHTLFGLADEYDAGGQASTMAPIEPNVCGSPASSQIKWADLVKAGTPVPTQTKGGPVPVGIPIGAYEGAKYQPSKVYRAEFDCKMRTPGKPFCAVCSRVISRLLVQHV
jgi:hypothetical protein